MQQYQIFLINGKEKPYGVISWLLLLLNFISLFFLTVSFRFEKWVPLIFAILAMVFSLVPLFLKGIHKKITHSWSFGLFSIAWFISHYFIFGIVNLILGILDLLARKPLFVRVDKYGVEYPSAIHKKVYWKDISNVIIKDGILTIDFKNNKLFQQLIDEKKQTINEKEFNDFCRMQLE
ncbi:MAG: hypothetical protein JST17_10815 [Bacteroidetes bacterium]|nr:hypothetical protein [Bacteroidota bacterium]MBS1930387.1 hypothetical protein [Bacteroidota bacterium]